MDKNGTELKLSYLPYSHMKKVSSVTLQNDECLTYFLFDAGKSNYKSLIYVEFIKKNRCDTGVYIDENVCDAASAPDWDGENIGCGIVDTSILNTIVSTPTPQCPKSPLALRCSQCPWSPQCPQLEMVVLENHEALDSYSCS